MQNQIDYEAKVFFNPGDVVKLRHGELENIPTMYVVEKVTRSILNKNTNASEAAFIGIKCRWFDKNSCLREGIFSTKDLIHVC